MCLNKFVSYGFHAGSEIFCHVQVYVFQFTSDFNVHVLYMYVKCQLEKKHER